MKNLFKNWVSFNGKVVEINDNSVILKVEADEQYMLMVNIEDLILYRGQILLKNNSPISVVKKEKV